MPTATRSPHNHLLRCCVLQLLADEDGNIITDNEASDQLQRIFIVSMMHAGPEDFVDTAAVQDSHCRRFLEELLAAVRLGLPSTITAGFKAFRWGPPRPAPAMCRLCL